jgi:hypothetical protein
MMQKPKNQAQNTQQQQAKKPAKPNESGTFYVEDHLKIFDPESKQVHLETRG